MDANHYLTSSDVPDCIIMDHIVYVLQDAPRNRGFNDVCDYCALRQCCHGVHGSHLCDFLGAKFNEVFVQLKTDVL